MNTGIQTFTYRRSQFDTPYGADAVDPIPHYLRREDEPIPKGGFRYAGISIELPAEIKPPSYSRAKAGVLVEMTPDTREDLRNATRASGKQMSDVAKHFGITRSSLGSMINSNVFMRIADLEKWCKFIGIDAGPLIDAAQTRAEEGAATAPPKRDFVELLPTAQATIRDALLSSRYNYVGFAVAVDESLSMVKNTMKTSRPLYRMPPARLERICAVLGLDAKILIKKD